MLGFHALGILTPGETSTYYTISPDADDTDGLWLTEALGTSLFGSIDETASDDADYINSTYAPVADVSKVSLSNPSVTPAEPMSVHYRFKKDNANGTMELRVRLMENTTAIATWTESNVSSNYLYVEHTLTAAEFAAITDFTALYLEFRANYP